MKKHIASLIAGAFAFALLAAPASAARITDLDRPIELTARVLSGTIVTDVARIYPEVGPDGTTYEPESVQKRRDRNLQAHAEHCMTHIKILRLLGINRFAGKSIADCGKGFDR